MTINFMSNARTAQRGWASGVNALYGWSNSKVVIQQGPHDRHKAHNSLQSPLNTPRNAHGGRQSLRGANCHRRQGHRGRMVDAGGSLQPGGLFEEAGPCSSHSQAGSRDAPAQWESGPPRDRLRSVSRVQIEGEAKKTIRQKNSGELRSSAHLTNKRWWTVSPTVPFSIV